MAAQANTASLVTNLNVDPYYDDFDESKKLSSYSIPSGNGSAST